jgi:hypothetical protein
MKVCIIFRGDNVRESHTDVNRRYIDILMCWDNLKKTLVDDLINNGHECEIVFITYPSEIIEKIKEVINPKYIEIHNKEYQKKNFEDVVTYMNNHKNEYDRFVILRCDFRYRFGITKWPKWNETGLFLVNKDVHWPSRYLYSDILFIVDSNSLNLFSSAFSYTKYCDTLHDMVTYLYVNKDPFHLMYDEYYHMDKHPLHSLASLEPEVDLDNPLVFEPINDISQWNPTNPNFSR